MFLPTTAPRDPRVSFLCLSDKFTAVCENGWRGACFFFLQCHDMEYIFGCESLTKCLPRSSLSAICLLTPDEHTQSVAKARQGIRRGVRAEVARGERFPSLCSLRVRRQVRGVPPAEGAVESSQWCRECAKFSFFVARFLLELAGSPQCWCDKQLASLVNTDRLPA